MPSVPIAHILIAASLVLGARRVLAESLKGSGNPLAGTLSEVSSWIALAIVLALTIGLSWGAVGVAWAVLASGATSLLSLLVIDRTHPSEHVDGTGDLPTVGSLLPD